MTVQHKPGYQAYQKNKYETASPHRLILMLYDGALTNINRAKNALDSDQRAEAHKFIQKAQAIVLELMACLNEEQGDVIAKNLKEIYFYLVNQLTQANIHKKKDQLLEVETILGDLRQTWDQLGKEVGNGSF
ncbi:flagellar export chaperone FliS [Cohnella cholangitidis]|uniref:Flagellar secretion chaperone FliS n=1 Tax=Cohnella cholangitidis TaxID=2598458 RepID=A0A7G5BXJ2_9BACL|nr:flagellar export chaperone FliS [Cohnella cholangitidis]QMV41676.1 flagellar export chaperone FliS [Cohnella cholangitidis]